MALFDLPTQLPFSLGSLQYPDDVRAQGTFVMPKRIPWTISALPAKVEPPYGTIGWEVVVRQHDNFDAIILKTGDFSGLLFSQEEDAVGGGSVTFDLDTKLFSKLLTNGRPASDLYEKENLWQAYFDGELRASWLGTNVKETQLQDSEIRQVTISGPGPAQVLEWAAVLPTTYPAVIPKANALHDSMSDELVDTTLWNASDGAGLSIARGGGREEAEQKVSDLQAEIDLAISARTSATEDMNQAKDYYNSIVKSNSYTKSEKDAALRAYHKAQAEVNTKIADVNAKQAQRAAAIQWRDTYPTPLVPNQMPSIKMTITSQDQVRLLSAFPRDMTDSAFSAWVDPLPQVPSSGGQAQTRMSAQINELGYARIYTRIISGRRRLVAEARTYNDVVRHDWDYSPTADQYWRIRESQGEFIFETGPTNQQFTERFRAAYGWDATKAQIYVDAYLEGSAGLTLPISAFVADVNNETLPQSQPLFAKFKEYLQQAQARGVIPYVTTSYTDDEDSAGSAWSSLTGAEVAEGVDLLKVLQAFAGAQQATWRMDPDFSLIIRQKVWAENEPDPTIQFHKEAQVVFHETGSQLFRERTRTREDIANYIVGKNAAGNYAFMQDEESMDKFQRRELFISTGTTDDLAITGTILSSTLETVKDEVNSWRIKVDPDQPGRRVFKDYGVGDWVGIENPETGNIDAWKVVGIAISVTEEGNTDLELTLQSRLELLAERLKAQVERLGGSSNSAGISVSNPVTAATLIQQAKLSSLLDVTLNQAEEGDVLTYNKAGGYWTAVQPGDKTVPDVPVITDTYSSVYQSGEDIWTKAQIEINWLTPLNTDGSTMTDGHHYEIRFRPDTTSPYAATWEEASQLSWEELHTWSQPTIPKISNDSWQTMYVGFDENQTILQELTPGVRYEIQIRAADTSTPQHWSEWSPSVLISAASDTIAPPTPAIPLVASSRLAIQITHNMGRFTGGEYNLPEDMDHFEVHVGGQEFYPTEETRVGKLPANLSMMRGRIPAIGTFQLEETDQVWVSLIAVDRTGNRSMASPPVTASVNLIDDAHISDLTASKITAGRITSAIVLAGIIRTAEHGARAEMDAEGFRIYADDGDPTVSLVGAPGLKGNFLLIKDPEDATKTLAGIDGSGKGSFQNLYVVDDVTIAGQSLMNDVINPMAKGIVAIGRYDGEPITGNGVALERGFMEISFIAVQSRTYRITAVTEWESTVANDSMLLRLRDYGTSNPFIGIGDPGWFQQSITQGANNAGGNATAIVNYAGTFSPGLHRILVSFAGLQGVAKVQAKNGSATESTSFIWVEDAGLPATDIMVLNDAGRGEYNAPPPPVGDAVRPVTQPKVTYTKNYNATWSGSYKESGAYSSSHGAEMTQGTYGSGSYLGDARGLVGFDDDQIRRDTYGSTISACYVTLYANHWYENNGGTARIGTHKYSSRPSSISSGNLNGARISSGGWPKPGKRKVSLGTTIGNEFKSGAARGIMVGPTNNSQDQYGKFNGNGQSNEPVLTIVYIK